MFTKADFYEWKYWYVEQPSHKLALKLAALTPWTIKYYFLIDIASRASIQNPDKLPMDLTLQELLAFDAPTDD